MKRWKDLLEQTGIWIDWRERFVALNIQNGGEITMVDRINDRINKKQLTQNQINVFNFIRDSAKDSDRIKGGTDRLTVGYISEQIKLSVPTVQRIMKVLEQNGLIRRVGSKKTGYWQIVD